MKNLTMYLPGFSHRLAGRRRNPEAARMAGGAEALDGLAALVAKFVPEELFAAGEKERKRVFTPWVTFVAFLGQTLSRGSACREAVRRVQAWRARAGLPVPDDSNSGYCQARERLSTDALESAHARIGGWIGRRNREVWQWQGRAVKVLDGCGVSMPDSEAEPCALAVCGRPEGGLRVPDGKAGGDVLFGDGTAGAFRDGFLEVARDPIGALAPGCQRADKIDPLTST